MNRQKLQARREAERRKAAEALAPAEPEPPQPLTLEERVEKLEQFVRDQLTCDWSNPFEALAGAAAILGRGQRLTIGQAAMLGMLRSESFRDVMDAAARERHLIGTSGPLPERQEGVKGRPPEWHAEQAERERLAKQEADDKQRAAEVRERLKQKAAASQGG